MEFLILTNSCAWCALAGLNSKHKNVQNQFEILKILGRKYISIIYYPGHFSKINSLQYQTKLNTEVLNYWSPFYTKVCCAVHLFFPIIPLLPQPSAVQSWTILTGVIL